MPTCLLGDDLSHPLGSPDEALLAAARGAADGRSCAKAGALDTGVLPYRRRILVLKLEQRSGMSRGPGRAQ